MRLRTVTPADAALLAGLHWNAMGPDDGWDQAGLTRLLSAPAARALIEVEGRGFILAFAAADEAEILALAVNPDHRRGGLARGLIRAIAGQLAEEGVVRLHLEVRASNLAARELYRNSGFSEQGRRKNYYRERPDRGAEDAILMSRSLERH